MIAAGASAAPLGPAAPAPGAPGSPVTTAAAAKPTAPTAPVITVGTGAAPSVAAKQPASWAAPQIAALVGAGVLGSSVEDFRPNDPLTRGELAEALVAMGYKVHAPSQPARRVKLRELDGQLVSVLGLIPESRAIRLAAAKAGLSPRPYLGTETVARILGLRMNHPQGQDELELRPDQPATRAEAAYSLATIRGLQPWQVDNVRSAVATLAFPRFTDWQRRIVGEAVRFVGMPYVWAGTSERSQILFGQTLPGGFDCSGLVWRVYKLQAYDGAATLTDIIKGRTTFAMSGEVRMTTRIAADALAPGDIIFFGDKGTQSSPLQVGHAGIYVGSGWFVHSSRNGVTLQPLQGWYVDRFAWARRPLAEAGLQI
jgi:cell wall-associated NlpC family hydrolase